jgi:hypothetical protein
MPGERRPQRESARSRRARAYVLCEGSDANSASRAFRSCAGALAPAPRGGEGRLRAALSFIAGGCCSLRGQQGCELALTGPRNSADEQRGAERMLPELRAEGGEAADLVASAPLGGVENGRGE